MINFEFLLFFNLEIQANSLYDLNIKLAQNTISNEFLKDYDDFANQNAFQNFQVCFNKFSAL